MPKKQTPRNAGESTQHQQKNRPVQEDVAAARERGLDQTIADSFPSSDPPSTIPNPDDEE